MIFLIATIVIQNMFMRIKTMLICQVRTRSWNPMKSLSMKNALILKGHERNSCKKRDKVTLAKRTKSKGSSQVLKSALKRPSNVS